MLEAWQPVGSAPIFYGLRNALGRVVFSGFGIKNQVGAIRVAGKLSELCQQLAKLRIRSAFVRDTYFFDETDKLGFSVFRYFFHVRSLSFVLKDVIFRGVDPEVVYVVDSAAISDSLDVVNFKYSSCAYRLSVSNRWRVARH